MTTLMRNGRDRRLGKPVKCHARKERVFLVGTRSADHIRASGHSGCIQRPDTWLHPNASLKRQIPLAPRAPSIHGTFETCRPAVTTSASGGRPEVAGRGQNGAFDPYVWSGRALQVDFSELAVCGLASMYPVSDWSCFAPDHHGYQRACDLVSGQASIGPFGSPVCARARKTEPPSRLILSQTSAGNC